VKGCPTHVTLAVSSHRQRGFVCTPENGIKEAVLFINNDAGLCGSCLQNLNSAIPTGARLRIIITAEYKGLESGAVNLGWFNGAG